MCGIIGFAGKKEAVPTLIDGLERLEYRGYDSAGVAVVSADGRLQVKKSKGRLFVLRELLDTQNPLLGNIGIGHTRWATHGEPNDTNAHPHIGQEGKIAVVHNGIIENYLEIKQSLIRKGVHFSSDTDTEVIVQLLEYYYRKKSNLMDAVYAVLHRIKGAYAMGILCSDYPEQMIAARKDAPLLIGYGEKENYIASDVTALLANTRTVTYMEDDEVAVITADQVQIYDRDRFLLEKEKHRIEWDVSAAEKGGYAHFMLKEIMEQPEAVRKTISPRLADGEIVLEELNDIKELAENISRIYIVACGSAYHVGMVGKYILEKLLHIPVEACLASEFRYSEPLLGESALVIVISQSGETLDSMAALREAKRKGSKVLSIVNVMGSSIARESDHVLYTWAGPEIAVATTKAYTTQMVLLIMFGICLAKQLNRIEQNEYTVIVRELQDLPEKISVVLNDLDIYQKAASRYFNHNSVFYIGRNLDYALGLEGSLKLKEISYIHSESYAAGELKHGTISLIEPGTLVVALATYEPLVEKSLSNIVEVKSRGAEVIAMTTEQSVNPINSQASEVFVIPRVHSLLQPVLGVIPLQLFAYSVALNRGCDIDKPRNLAKSVTVE
ncbi:glutamine--fructose-6-phosphate transaminase (isomerizing) [Mediterraneibacter agrestimuris]|uniref:glutamine--fructose-6-phosphate transaminase (isomerizing) n=1 Tax=Mediterraneibacter agrestimuris TaxID=2941333 RepID=UPI00204185C1|nr:glutamine--fructose-6-phosphate transaminase (isomerizing) [Mediterraneibacter agrestimuris]